MFRRLTGFAILAGILVVTNCFAQEQIPPDAIPRPVAQEILGGKWADAARDLRDVTQKDSMNIYAQFFLGHSLYMQKKYAEAAGPYERALDLDSKTKTLSLIWRRVLVDELIPTYGISGDLKKAHALAQESAKRDPDYPMNYYNLACAFAEENNKPKMLENLSLAFQHKDNVLRGEQMPDPRSDDSFQKFARDADFMKLMRQLGYN